MKNKKINFSLSIEDFKRYIDALSKDFEQEQKKRKKELSELKNQLPKFENYIHFFQSSKEIEKKLLSIDFQQMQNSLNIYEFLINEIFWNRKHLIYSMKWNYILVKSLKGSKSDKLEKEIQEIKESLKQDKEYEDILKELKKMIDYKKKQIEKLQEKNIYG